MEKLKNLIKNDVLPNIKGSRNFAIFLNEHNEYDIYIQSSNIEYCYFVNYVDDTFYDLNFKEIAINEIQSSIYEIDDIIEDNYLKFLQYKEIYIEETNRTSAEDYIVPKITDAENYIDEGDKDFNREDFLNAFKNYNFALSLEPYISSHYRRRASCYVEFKQFQNAIFDCCRAAVANPINHQNIFIFVYQDVAELYHHQKDYLNAIKFYSIIYKHTNNIYILQNRAKCYVELNNYSQAFSDYDLLFKDERRIEMLFDYAQALIKFNDKIKAGSILNEIIDFSFPSEENWIIEMMENHNKSIKERAKKLLKKI